MKGSLLFTFIITSFLFSLQQTLLKIKLKKHANDFDFELVDFSYITFPQSELEKSFEGIIGKSNYSDAILISENFVEFPNIHQIFFIITCDYFKMLFEQKNWKNLWQSGGRLPSAFDDQVLSCLVRYCYTGTISELNGEIVVGVLIEAEGKKI